MLLIHPPPLSVARCVQQEVDTINQSSKVMKFTCNIKKMKYCSNIRKKIMKFQKFSCCSHKLLLYLTFTYRGTSGAFP
jgi:hypothetical protein